MKRTLTLKNQKGFTLIEIIAVLIILGILAAIAVPKYMSLTQDAADKACIQGVAEGMSQCTNANAQLMLQMMWYLLQILLFFQYCHVYSVFFYPVPEAALLYTKQLCCFYLLAISPHKGPDYHLLFQSF